VVCGVGTIMEEVSVEVELVGTLARLFTGLASCCVFVEQM